VCPAAVPWSGSSGKFTADVCPAVQPRPSRRSPSAKPVSVPELARLVMDTQADQPTGRFDSVTADLRALRTAAGEPSFGELTKRVVHQRMQRGMSEWEARVGRTTVYDAFRPGRRNIDPELIGDLALALGVPDDEAAVWVKRCQALRSAPNESAQLAAPVDLPSPTPRVLKPRLQVAFMVGCVAINLFGRVLVNATHLPLYLDMVGTAISAIILGPWKGAAVGTVTSVAGSAASGWVSVPFAPVEIVGALIWGYGVRRFRMGTTVPRFFVLNAVVAVTCSVIAVPIIVWVDNGITGNGADQITRTMELFWHSLFVAVLSQNILTSLADKLVSGFVALGVAEAMPAVGNRSGLRLTSPWLQTRSLLMSSLLATPDS
jgi:energy-coupling factor transport system substrate-specific component